MNEMGDGLPLNLVNQSLREISSSNQNACIAAGLRPDPLGEGGGLSAPPAPNRSDCHGREHSQVQLGALCDGEEWKGLSGRAGAE